MTEILDLAAPLVPVTGVMPEVICQTSTEVPLSASPSWTDEITRLRNFASKRGKSFELDDVEAGSLSARFLNLDRRFDPDDPALLLPFMRIRVGAIYGTTIYAVWDGFVDRWSQPGTDTSNRYAETSCTATDIFQFFALCPIRALNPLILGDADRGLLGSARLAGNAEFREEVLTGTRVGQLLDLLDVPAELRDVDDGLVTVLADTATDDETVLSYAKRLHASEYGRFHAGADGKATFWGRHHWYETTTQKTSQLTLTDQSGGLGYTEITLEPADRRTIRNRVVRQSPRGRPQVAYDPDSIAQFGLQEDSDTDLLTTSVSDMASLAQHILAKYQAPLTRVASVVVNPQIAPATLFPKVLGLDLGDRITIERQIAGIGAVFSEEYWIERIVHDATPTSWHTTWELSPADPSTGLFILGTSELADTDVLAF